MLLKKLANGHIVDSYMLYKCQHSSGIAQPMLAYKESSQFMKEYFSTFFRIVPYVRYDRLPWTVIASMQAIQGVCLPWAAGNLAYAPMYSNIPLCITDFTAEMFTTLYGTYKTAYLGKLVAQSDVLPGWSLLTVLVNLTYTYEDATIVSEAAV